MSKLRCTAYDIDVDKRMGRAKGVHNPLARGTPPKPWYPRLAQVKGSYAGDVGWNVGAGEHQFFNRRHPAPDRFRSTPLMTGGADATSFATASSSPNPFDTSVNVSNSGIGGFATDRHTLFSSIADRRFNRVDGDAYKRVDMDVRHQFLRLPGAPSGSFMMTTQAVGGFGGGGGGRGRGGGGGGGGRAGGVNGVSGVGVRSGGPTPVSSTPPPAAT